VRSSRKKTAAISSATPIKSWMPRRGIRLTIPAPIQAPTPELTTMLTSNTGSTAMAPKNSRALMKAGTALPTLSVPGINSSCGLPRSLNKAVICA